MGAKATAVFEGDDAKLNAVFKSIGKQLDKLQSEFAAVGGFAAKLFAAPAAAAVALGAGIKNALDVGGHFADLSAATGISVKNLVALEQEFANAGKSGDDVGKVISKMQKALAEGGAADVIAGLGLDLEKLKAQAPVDQFHALGTAIDSVQNPAERAGAAMAIFGKEGASLLSMFSSKGFGDAAKQVGNQAELLNKDAALFDDAGDKLNLVGSKLQGFFVGLADQVVPLLKPLLDEFAEMDFSQIGQQVGEALGYLVQAFQDGKLGEILGTSLEISLGEATQFFQANMLGAAAAIGAALQKVAAAFNSLMLEGMGKMVTLLPGDQSARAAKAKRAADYVSAKGDAIDVGEAYTTARDAAPAFDGAALQMKLASLIDSVLTNANAQRGAAYAANPTLAGRNGDVSSLFDMQGGAQSAVSALTRIGGNFGGNNGVDPLIGVGQKQIELLAALVRQGEAKTPFTPPSMGSGVGYA